MKAPGLNLGGLLDRLGIQSTGDAPDLVDALVPVLIAADAQAVVPPIRGVSAWLGLEVGAAAANVAAWRIISRAAGGMWVRYLSLQGGPLLSTMAFFANPITSFGNPFFPPPAPPGDPYLEIILRTASPNNLTPQTVVSVLQSGQSYAATALVFNVTPVVTLAANTRQTYLTNLFLPPGWVLFGEFNQANPNNPRVDMLIEEIPTVSTER